MIKVCLKYNTCTPECALVWDFYINLQQSQIVGQIFIINSNDSKLFFIIRYHPHIIKDTKFLKTTIHFTHFSSAFNQHMFFICYNMLLFSFFRPFDDNYILYLSYAFTFEKINIKRQTKAKQLFKISFIILLFIWKLLRFFAQEIKRSCISFAFTLRWNNYTKIWLIVLCMFLKLCPYKNVNAFR